MSAPRPAPAGGLLREPLVWFGIVGLGIFGLDRLWPAPVADGPIPVSDATVVGLVAGFAEGQGRAPTDPEVQALIETHADEQRALREARSLGLDRADPVVRRRLLQKLAFLDAGALPDPGDAALAAFLADQPERFARPVRTDGVAIRIAPGVAPGPVLASLAAGAEPGGLGEAGPHPPGWTGLDAGRLAARTDPAVAAALDGLVLGAWSSVPTAAGTWLIRLDARQGGGAPPLASVREAVLAGWQAAERERRLGAAREARRARWPTLRR